MLVHVLCCHQALLSVSNQQRTAFTLIDAKPAEPLNTVRHAPCNWYSMLLTHLADLLCSPDGPGVIYM